jgi:hypothetical protein
MKFARITLALVLVYVGSLGCKPGTLFCESCPVAGTGGGGGSPCAEAGGGGAGGAGGGEGTPVTLTRHRECGPGKPSCTAAGGVPSFECTAYSGQCYTAGSAGVGHCLSVLAPASSKCITGARMACTTHTGAKGVYVCNGCDWATDGCVPCGQAAGGARADACCVDGCSGTLRCDASDMKCK